MAQSFDVIHHKLERCDASSLLRSTSFQSDLKQNGTQEKKQFSGTVFNALSHGVIRFVACVSFKNHQMDPSDWLLKKFNRSEGGFWS